MGYSVRQTSMLMVTDDEKTFKQYLLYKRVTIDLEGKSDEVLDVGSLKQKTSYIKFKRHNYQSRHERFVTCDSQEDF